MSFDRLKRREFISLLGGAAAWPLAARAQQPALPVIGYLSGDLLGPQRDWVAAFHRGMNETGYVEGRNVAIEYRWAEGQYERLPALAADLVHRQVTAIAAADNVSALAAKAATATIPIIFRTGADPVMLGLVASFNRPGGNITGVGFFASQMVSKRLALLHEIVPKAALIAMLAPPNSPTKDTQITQAQDAARAIGVDLLVLTAGTERDLDAAFTTLVQRQVRALLIGGSPSLRGDQIIAMAARNAIPAIYDSREYVAAGGLLSYGTNFTDSYRQLGIYTGQILRGTKPADMPVMQSTKFELVINLKTSKALGLDISPALLSVADELIE
jgi:putative tryptophan/tyrosine transport system substrate-binding protein